MQPIAESPRQKRACGPARGRSSGAPTSQRWRRRRSLRPPIRRRGFLPRSRALESESLYGCLYGANQFGRGRKLRSPLLPALRPDDALLLQSLPLQEIVPTVRARVDEELEIRVQRELILRGVYRELHTAVSTEQHFQPRDLLAHV